MRTTLTSFLAEIASDPNDALVFTAGASAIRPRYHVSEIKLAHVQSIDCGRGTAQWHETLVQLLDGPRGPRVGGKYMTAGKFSNIAQAASGSIGDPAEGELFFEFAPENTGMQKFTVDTIEHQDGTWIVRLNAVRAACNPVQKAFAAIGVGKASTDASRATQSCCGG